MQYNWESPEGRLILEIDTNDRSLRPWDAADEYLMDTLREKVSRPEKIGIMNDIWGALTCASGKSCLWSSSDSYKTMEYILKNRVLNDLPPVNLLNLTESTPVKADLILMKIPKSLSLFTWQLKQLNRRVPAGTPVRAAGHSRNLPPSFFATFESAVNGGTYSLIRKKARFYEGTLTGNASEQILQENFTWETMHFTSLPGVFSHGRIDPGTAFFLSRFPRFEAPRRIVDPGCGAGVLSVAAAVKWPEAEIIATDDSLMAVESTRLNALRNGVEKQIQVLHRDILKGIESSSADLVLCNPPFHQDHRVSVESGLAFIRESARVLKPKGQMFFVANKHLGYLESAKSVFAGVRIMASNPRFCIYMCRK